MRIGRILFFTALLLSAPKTRAQAEPAPRFPHLDHLENIADDVSGFKLVCKTCHPALNAGPDPSQFKPTRANCSVTDCHEGQHEGETEKTTPASCAATDCHERAETAQHSELNPGNIACAECHGLPGDPALKNHKKELHPSADSAPPSVCFQCHADKKAPPLFSHNKHATATASDIKDLCGECHTDEADKTTFVKPTQKQCFGCHDSDFDKGLVEGTIPSRICTSCHARAETQSPDRSNLRPDHEERKALAKEKCGECHALKGDPVGRNHDFDQHNKPGNPLKSFCQKCHAAAKSVKELHKLAGRKIDKLLCSLCHGIKNSKKPKQDNCSTCHPGAKKSEIIRTAHGFVTPVACGECHTDEIGDTHERDSWERDHNNSPLTEQLCYSCHQKQTCVSCHLQNRHSLESLDDHEIGFLMGQRDCSACHPKTHKGCVQCHDKSHAQSNRTFEHYSDDPREAFRREGRKCVQCHQPNAAFEQAIRRRGNRHR